MRTMPKFDDTIRQAILRACEAAGGECALAAAVGCSQAQISRYRTGGFEYIRRDNWEKLYPHIAPYLPEDFQQDTEPPKRKNSNESIYGAIDAAARNHPRGAFGLAADAGFTPAQICRYRHGKVSWFTSKTLNKLYPHIAPYLPERNPRVTESPFPVGTTVRLKSGGPLMTVDRIGDCTVECVWFRGKEALRESFAVAALLRDATGLAECIKNQVDNNNHKEDE